MKVYDVVDEEPNAAIDEDIEDISVGGGFVDENGFHDDFILEDDEEASDED